MQPLPGTTQADDRFVRTAYYLAHLPATDDERQAIASVLSVTRGAAQPFGTVDPARPNISATRWSTVADLTNMVYYFESTTSPNIVWARLDALDFSLGAPALKLDLVSLPDRVGDVSASIRCPARLWRTCLQAARRPEGRERSEAGAGAFASARPHRQRYRPERRSAGA